MTKLKPCPCGKTPTAIGVYDYSSKWNYAVPDCCGEWNIDFRTHYECDEMVRELAIAAWNEAPRDGLK